MSPFQAGHATLSHFTDQQLYFMMRYIKAFNSNIFMICIIIFCNSFYEHWSPKVSHWSANSQHSRIMAHTKTERETSLWQRKYKCGHTMITAMVAMVSSLMFWKVGPDILVVYENIHYSQLTANSHNCYIQITGKSVLDQKNRTCNKQQVSFQLGNLNWGKV